MKKTVYIFLCMVLVALLSLIAHLLATAWLVLPVASRGWGPFGLLPGWAWYSVPLTGVIGGFFLGKTWWRIVYVERRHWRMRRS